MQKRAAAIVAALLFALPAWAQTAPTNQSGPTLPGDIAKMQSNGKITSGGGIYGDANGKGVNPFSIYDRGDKGLCFRSGQTGSPHTAFCIGHDANGNVILSLDSYGGEAAKQLRCQINGVEGPCFAAGSSGGVELALTLHSGSGVTLHSGNPVTLHGN